MRGQLSQIKSWVAVVVMLSAGYGLRADGVTVAPGAAAATSPAKASPRKPFRPERPQGPLSLHVQVVDAGGKRFDRAQFTAWRQVKPQEEPLIASATDPPLTWRDPSTGQTWTPFHSYGAGSEVTVRELPPGTYRVSASAYRGGQETDPTPAGITPPVALTPESQAETITLALTGDTPLTVKVVRADTREPFGRVRVRLRREDGLPVGQGSAGFWHYTDEHGIKRYGHLEPGRYTIEIPQSPQQRFDTTEYKPAAEHIRAEVKAGKDNVVEVPLHAVALTQAEIDARWPWVVTGEVTDDRGQPLRGVTVGASCGVGTLWSTGRATTAADGSYTLRFSGAMRSLNEDTGQWEVGPQAAVIGASLEGYYDKGLGRHGGLFMASRKPEADNAWNADPNKVLLPGRPYRLDFVLVPAAKITGRIVDLDGKPVKHRLFSLDSDLLPPASSVLANATSDDAGRFTMQGLPCQSCWFELRTDKGKTLMTKELDLAAPGDYEVRLTLGEGRFEAELIRAPAVRVPHR